MDDMIMLTMTGLMGRVARWVNHVLGNRCLMDKKERAARLIEEAIELGQVEGVTEAEVILIADRVYSRPVGQREQEVGGIGVCLLAYCYAAGLDFQSLTQREVERIEALDPNIIRTKHAAKAAAGTAVNAIPPEDRRQT